jgi:hypothetical protein
MVLSWEATAALMHDDLSFRYTPVIFSSAFGVRRGLDCCRTINNRAIAEQAMIHFFS